MQEHILCSVLFFTPKKKWIFGRARIAETAVYDLKRHETENRSQTVFHHATTAPAPLLVESAFPKIN
jgi:hypothetical protein